MTEDELREMTPDKTVDARGTSCPGPMLEAKKAIGTIQSGQVIEVLSSDEGTRRDIPKWCKKKGHEYLGIVEEAGYFRVFLRKQ